MSKRDSLTAGLPGRYDMAEEMDTLEGSYSGNLRENPQFLTPVIPTASTTGPLEPSSSHHAPRDPPYMGTAPRPLHLNEYRTRTVHTVKFQKVEHGSHEAKLKIEETDEFGYYSKYEYSTLKHHVFGIVGHLSNQIDGWQVSEQLSNYWRDHFGIPRRDKGKHSHHMPINDPKHQQRRGMQSA